MNAIQSIISMSHAGNWAAQQLGYRTLIREVPGTATRMSKLTTVLDVTAGSTTQSRSLSLAGGSLM